MKIISQYVQAAQILNNHIRGTQTKYNSWTNLYKTTIDLKPGDIIIVADTKADETLYTFAKVIEFPFSYAYNISEFTELGHVVQKLDFTNYDNLIEYENKKKEEKEETEKDIKNFKNLLKKLDNNTISEIIEEHAEDYAFGSVEISVNGRKFKPFPLRVKC